MSEVIRRLEEIAGVEIGGRREPRKPFPDALTERTAVNVTSHWVTEIRAGRYGGRRTLIRADLSKSDPNDPSKKDRLYRRIATEGVSLRTYVAEPGLTHAYATNHLVEDIATNLHLRDGDIRQLLRAMRADAVFGYTQDNEFNQIFIRVANEYLWAHTEKVRPSKRYPVLVEINERWDRQSPVTFYQQMYSELTGSTTRIRGFVPYELEAMKLFYEGRTLRGRSEPTRFDSEIFKYVSREETASLAEDVRNQTGVLIDESTVLKHRNALVYGKPTTGLF